tara:strand:- start:1612 stop:1809 length:198 start_codon:yes stop_codon:yes gene_type:complete
MEDTKQKLIIEFINFLEDDDFKDIFLKELNEEINIPILNEEREGKIFKALYGVIIKSLRKKCDKK